MCLPISGTHSPQAREVVVRLRDYGFAWVPTVSDALSIAVSGPRAEIVSDSLHYDMSSATGIATAGLTGGDVLTEPGPACQSFQARVDVQLRQTATVVEMLTQRRLGKAALQFGDHPVFQEHRHL